MWPRIVAPLIVWDSWMTSGISNATCHLRIEGDCLRANQPQEGRKEDVVSVFTIFYWKAMAYSHITVSNDLFILKLPSPNHKLTQNVQQLQKECFMLFKQFWNELRKRVNECSHCSWGGRNH